MSSANAGIAPQPFQETAMTFARPSFIVEFLDWAENFRAYRARRCARRAAL